MKKIIIILMLVNAFVTFAEEIRVVSLAPAVTEIVYYLGMEKKLVGVTTACDYPEQAKQKEKIGDFTNPNVEKIISLKPTIIIGMDLNEIKMARFRELGIKYENIKCESVSQIGDAIDTIGKLCGDSKLAKEKSLSFDNSLKQIKESSAGKGFKPRVIAVIYDTPIICAGKGSIIDEVINIAGGVNITVNSYERYPLYSVEYILAAKPDIILTEKNMKIDKIKGNSIVLDDVDPSLYMRAGPRILKGIEKIKERFDKVKKK